MIGFEIPVNVNGFLTLSIHNIFVDVVFLWGFSIFSSAESTVPLSKLAAKGGLFTQLVALGFLAATSD